MAITTMDALVAGLASGFRAPFQKAALTLSAASQWGSFWTTAGFPGAAAVPPAGAGEAPTAATPGALYFTNPTSGNSYLAGLEGSVGNGLCLPFLYDRLVHTSGLDGTVITAQTVNSAAITRPDATGVGAELFIECYTQTGGAAALTTTISYTNSSGVAGQSATAAIPANMHAGQLIPASLAPGDFGVRSVQSVTLSGSTGAAGNFGITIARRVASLPVGGTTNTGAAVDPFALGLPRLYNDSCLWFVCFAPSSASPGPLQGLLAVAQG